jgi:hypothetical protein
MSFPIGSPGILVALGILGVVWVLIGAATPKHPAFNFEKNPGDFDKLLPIFLDIAKFVLGLAAGGIVLVISSTALSATRKLPPSYASPLAILAGSVLYGILFMTLLTTNYESFKHDPQSYLRAYYVRNQALGFSALACFCIGYIWLIVAALNG